MKKLFYVLVTIVAVTLFGSCDKEGMLVGCTLYSIDFDFRDADGNDLMNPETRGSLYGSMTMKMISGDNVYEIPTLKEYIEFNEKYATVENLDSLPDFEDRKFLFCWSEPDERIKYYTASLPGISHIYDDSDMFLLEIYVDSKLVGTYDFKLKNVAGRENLSWEVNGEILDGRRYTVVL